MSLKIDRLQLEIVINNDQARKSLRLLEDEARQLKKDLKKVPEGSDEWNKISNRLKAIQMQHDGIIEKLGIEKLSIKELGQRQRELNAILRQMDPSMKGYAELKQQLDAINLRQAELKGKTQQTNASLSKMAQGFNKYFTMVTAGIATVTGVFFSIKELITGLSDLDDQIANVMKTTGLTKKEVRELHSEFKYLNTRTPRKELMLLAEEAGRLGKKSKKDVMDFVEVANQIKIALGDDLGGNAEEAIREVGKLTTIYKIGEQYGIDFKESMLKVGSAINEVSANSQAQAPFLIETLKRLGGLATQAGIMADEVIGYGSALDQLGQRTEMSSTALSKVILNMFTDTSTYAKIAKIELGEFTHLLNTDANEAFLKVLEGLNGNNDGLAVMGEKMADLGLDGSRAVQVLASLAGNTEMVRKEQDLANKAMKEGTSLTKEYNVKNENMAGNLEKIGRAMHAWFINSSVNKGMEKFVGYFAELVKFPLSEKLDKERLSINGLVIEMTSANTTAERRNTIYKQLMEMNPDIVAGIDLENISIVQLSKNLALYNEEQIKKIALQKSDEELTKAREEYGKTMGSRIEAEQSAYTKMARIKEDIAKIDANAANEIKKIMLGNADIQEKAEAIKDIAYETSKWYTYTSTAYGGLKYDMAEVNRLKEKELENQNEFKTSFAEYQEMYNQVMDKSATQGAYPGPPLPPDLNKGGEENTATTITTLKTQLEALNKARNEINIADTEALLKNQQEIEAKEALIKKYEDLGKTLKTVSKVKASQHSDFMYFAKVEEDQVKAMSEEEKRILNEQMFFKQLESDQNKANIEQDLKDLEEKYKREKTLAETRYNEELLALGTNEAAKKALKTQFEADELQRNLAHLNELKAKMEQSLQGINLDDAMLSDEDRDALLIKIDELKLAISELMLSTDTDSDGNGYVAGKLSKMLFGFDDGDTLFERIAKVGQFAVTTFSKINQIISNSEQKQLQDFIRANEDKKKALEQRLNAGKISQTDYKNAIDALDDEMAKRQRKVAHDQAVRNKAIAVMQAIVNTAAGVAAQLSIPGAGIGLAVAAGVIGAIEIAIAASTPVPALAQGNRQKILADDGKTYNAKVADKNHKSGLFSEPTYVPGFGLFGETKDPELVFNPEETNKIINSPALIDAINMTLGSSRQFAQGNSREIIRENNTVTNTTMDADTKALLDDIRKKLDEPATAYLVADEDYIRTHKKKVTEYDTFQKKIGN